MSPTDLTAQRQAMLERLDMRVACEGKLVLPAVPSLVDEYTQRCAQVFAAAGRPFNEPETQRLREVLAQQLTAAFERSQRAAIVLSYSAETGQALQFWVNISDASLAQTYESWVRVRQPPFFGLHPDAKALAVTDTLSDSGPLRVLDVGAGTGRNALALARRGHHVDAIELTASFAQTLRQTAQQECLPVRVIEGDVFKTGERLEGPYQLVLLSEVSSDFRSTAQLRAFFELMQTQLASGGYLLINAFITQPGYCEDKAAREFAQLAYSAFFSPEELTKALHGLDLQPISDESVHDFEHAHLPAEQWPPTPWYAQWTSGLDVFKVPRERSPIDLRWLLFRKR